MRLLIASIIVPYNCCLAYDEMVHPCSFMETHCLIGFVLICLVTRGCLLLVCCYVG
ncbi:hypothetical protein HanIR_Chr12g0588131 [Helianthus annuus]|nr:hypothetical protein HanIR_Chr12g0588131 [Helianthus annuus]